MGMAAPHTDWTVERLQALPDDGNRYEIIDGELLVTPAPSFDHQGLVMRLAMRLEAYLSLHRVGYVRIAPGDVILDSRTLVQPDVFVVPPVDGRRPRSWSEAPTPMLAIEVLSPSSARADRVRKRDLYRRAGVAEYWIVDPEARVIERWRPGEDRPEILSERIAWAPAGVDAAEPMTIELAEFWREVFEG